MMVRFRRLSLVAAALSSSTIATFAQVSVPDAQQLQRVEVTGSRVKRLESETPAPVQVITREQIEKSGAVSVAEVLKTLPAGNYGGFDENAVSSFSPGAASVSLRGMGTQATLVLVNGRRVAPYGFAANAQSTFVDLNAIPLEAVERIDVLLDGASALYGSDAMAGVINIILRKDFSGFQVRGGFGQSSYGDATSKQGALTFGKGSLASDGYNFIVNFEHHEQKPVKASERSMTASSDFSAVAGPFADFRSSYAYPGNLYTVGGASGEGTTLLGPLAGCTPVADGSVLSGGCVYDGVKHKDVVADTSRDLFVLSSTFSLGGGAQLFGDLMLGRSRFLQASNSFGTDFYYGLIPSSAITLPVGHPQNPYGTDVALRTSFADVPNTVDVVSDTRRLMFGARGAMAGWDAESAFVHSRSKTTVDTRGFVRDSVLLNEVLDPGNGYAAQPGFIFGNPAANDPALMARLYPTLRDNGKASTTSIDVRGNRDLMVMAGGPMALAVGAELRRETFQTRPDPLVAAFEISGLGSSSADGSRKVSAVYTELSAPVFKGLETQLALRTDHYSDFGTATTPKLGLKWKASSQLALRATYSRGFRAPSLPELVSAPSTGFYPGVSDPLLCPNPPDLGNPNCQIPYVQAELGGNPGLKPEKSKSFTAGVVFEPVRNLSIAFDAYRTKRIDEITFLDPNFLLANEAQFPGYVERDPGTQELTLLKLPYTNLGTTRLWGYDIDVKARVPLAELGALSLEATYNRQPRYVVQPVPGAAEQDWAGAYLTPKERFTIGAGWDRGPWSSKLVWNYVGGYSRALSSTDSACPYAGSAYEAMCSVKPWSTTDLYLSYSGFKNLQLSVSVRNIENKQAPIDERNLAYYTAFNSALHNQLGRYVTLNAKYTFW